MVSGVFERGSQQGKPPSQSIAVPSARSSSGEWLPAALLLATGLAALMFVSVSASGRAGQYLVVLPPGSGAGETLSVVAAADGALVEPGRFGNIAFAGSPDPGFGRTARAAGAWIVVPSPLLAGCGGTRVREGQP